MAENTFNPDLVMFRHLSARRPPDGPVNYRRLAVITANHLTTTERLIVAGSIDAAEETPQFLLLREEGESSSVVLVDAAGKETADRVADKIHVITTLTPWMTRAEIIVLAAHIADTSPLASTWPYLARVLALGCLLAEIPDDSRAQETVNPPAPMPGPEPTTVAEAFDAAIADITGMKKKRA